MPSPGRKSTGDRTPTTWAWRTSRKGDDGDTRDIVGRGGGVRIRGFPRVAARPLPGGGGPYANLQLSILVHNRRRSHPGDGRLRPGSGSDPADFRRFDGQRPLDRKSTRLNSSHANISYAVFCL